MGKMLSQANVKLVWVPAAGITNVQAVTAAMLNAGTVVDLSCLVSKSNYVLGATGDESISDPALCDEGNTSVPGNTNYEAGMDFFRYEDTVDDDAWALFTDKGLDGFLVERRGKLYSTAFATGDVVSIFPVITGTPRALPVPENGGYEKFHVDFFPQSGVDLRFTVIAGA